MQTPEAKAALLAYQDKHFTKKDLSAQNEKEIHEALREPTPLAVLKKIWQTKKLADGTLAVIAYKGEDTDIVVPDKFGPNLVTVIGEYAFSPDKPRLSADLKAHHESIKSVVLPAGITVIEANAFDGCRMLQSVSLPGTLKTIGEYAFNGSGITSIEIPGSVETVGRLALHFSTVREVIVSAGVGALEGLFGINPTLNTVRICGADTVTRDILNIESFFKRTAEDYPELTVYAPTGSDIREYCLAHGVKFEEI